MVERYAHVAPEALQGAAGRLDGVGRQLLGYDLASPNPEGVNTGAGPTRNDVVPESDRDE
jgi:hypothetical protein